MCVSYGTSQSIHEFATDYAENEYNPAVADSDGGYDTSTKIGLLLLKEEINKPLRSLEDYLNEMQGILDVFALEASPDHSSFSLWDGEFPMKYQKAHTGAIRSVMYGTRR